MYYGNKVSQFTALTIQRSGVIEMRLPTLRRLASKDVHVQIGDGSTDENGAVKISEEFDVKAKVEYGSTVIHTKEGTKVTLKAKAFIFDQLDKFPSQASGSCTIDGITYEIVNANKKFCPDGSAHHIVLELL